MSKSGDGISVRRTMQPRQGKVRLGGVRHTSPKKTGLLFSRVATRPADHATGSSGVGSGGVCNLTGRVGPGQNVFKSRGSGRVALTKPDP